jgi:hypothetical protein
MFLAKSLCVLGVLVCHDVFVNKNGYTPGDTPAPLTLCVLRVPLVGPVSQSLAFGISLTAMCYIGLI